ncbi:MAG: phosphoribosyl-ATP diphosphatase [Ahrensia sp.]
MTTFSLQDLEAIITERASVNDGSSWTAKLVAGGMQRVGKKFGEEATETLIAALSEDDPALVGESADLLYHWLVLLHMRNIPLQAVLDELQSRTEQSGLAEKAARPST